MSEAPGASWTIVAQDEAATTQLAETISAMLGAGDLVTLTGDLGAGKTAFARALIRTLRDDPDLEVPSPTYTFIQVYEGQVFEGDTFPIVHADLYRIESAGALDELGWEEAGEGALVIVEWIERVPELAPIDRLDINLRALPGRENAREIVVTGHGAFAQRLAKSRDIENILAKAGWRDAHRTFMLGDASTRAYERLTKPNGETAILMISPPRPDGPPLRYGKSYSAIARLAESITPFVAMAEALRAQTLSAPRIYASALDTGHAVIEDLGEALFVDDNGPIRARYSRAVDVLAALHSRNLPDRVPLSGTTAYVIPPYDLDALLVEVELLTEWYAPHVSGQSLSSGQRATFLNLWRQVLLEIASGPQTWTLRDVHSPNLIWLPEREGLAQVGLIDFQDCVMGHPAYDLAALLQDARVSVPADMELGLLGHYAQARRAASPDFDLGAFARAYAIMGAQRATKILGIFARLDKRDGKPHYRVHIPRVANALQRNLAHPALTPLREWYDLHLQVAASQA